MDFQSESEMQPENRYSKKAIELMMIDKSGKNMNLGGQNIGLKGSKVRPIYFPFSHIGAS